MNSFVITNPEARSKCFSHFRGMRLQRERIDILFQFTEIDALYRVVNAAVEFAYGGVEELSLSNAIKLYHLAHILQGGSLIDGCREFIIANIEKIEKEDVFDAWLAANASKNEDLMKACAPLVVMNWDMFRESRPFHVNTESIGIMNLLGCPQMSQESGTSKVKTLLTWRNFSRDNRVLTARTNAFRNVIPLLGNRDGWELLTDLNDEGVDIPIEWRNWLLEEQGGTREILSAFGVRKRETYVRIFNAELTEVETERKLPDRICYCVVSFRSKLVFIGGLNRKESGSDIFVYSNKVDLMDPSTGQVSALPNMLKAREKAACVANEKEIFVFRDYGFDRPGVFTSEVYEAISGRWSFLPPMIEDRGSCAAVSIPNCGILVIGGRRRRELLRSTELLTRSSGEGDERWQWRQFPPMNKEQEDSLAVYFQGRVYVVGYGESLDSMEMLDVSGRQWTSLSSFGSTSNQSLKVNEILRVGNKLFVQELHSNSLYSIELESDPKRQYEKLGQSRKVSNVRIDGFLTMFQLKT